MNIVVTGAAGFVGSHLAERLVGMGHTVHGIDCYTDYYARALKDLNTRQLEDQGVIMFPLDLAADDLSVALHDVDVVYHLAAQPGISATTTFHTYVENNIFATQRLLDVAKRSNRLRAFINIATSSVYGADATGSETTEPRPTSLYGVTKLAGEQLVLAQARDQGLPGCSLRLFSVYGPRERPDKLYHRLIKCILEDQPFPLYEGSEHHLRSFTYVDDIVDGFIGVLNNLDRCYGEILNIGTDTAITTGEGIQIVEQIIGKPAKIERCPKRAGDQLRTHANIEKARNVLGYQPSTSPGEGLEKEVAWYRNHVHQKISV